MPQREATSFCNERTVEYALVEPLLRAMESRFESASVLFFWSTREGCKTSARVHHDLEAHVLAVFARRPKVCEPGIVVGKINQSLIDFAQAAIGRGVPTVAALPVCSDIPALFAKPPIVWLDVNRLSRETVFQVDQRDPDHRPTTECGEVLPSIPTMRLADLASFDMRAMPWSDAVALMRSLRAATDSLSRRLPFHQGYRPVYVLCQQQR